MPAAERLVPGAEREQAARQAAEHITISVPQPQLLPVDAAQTSPAALGKRWEELSADERALADSLGFDEGSWAADEEPTPATLSRENSSLRRSLSSTSSASPDGSALARASSLGALARNRSALARHGSASSALSPQRSIGVQPEYKSLADEMRANLLETAPALSIEDANEIVRDIFRDTAGGHDAEPTAPPGEESTVLVHMPPGCEQFHLSVRISLSRTLAEFMAKVEQGCGIPPAEQIYTRDVYGREPIAGSSRSSLADLGIEPEDLIYLKRGSGGGAGGLSPVSERPSSARPQPEKRDEPSPAQPPAASPPVSRPPAAGAGYAIDDAQAKPEDTKPERQVVVPTLAESRLDAMGVKELMIWVTELGLPDLARDLERHRITGLRCFGEMQAQADWTWQDLHAFLCSLGLQPSSAAAMQLHAAVQDILCTDRGMMLLALATKALGETVEVAFAEEGKLGITFASVQGGVPGPTRISKIDRDGLAAWYPLRPGMVLLAAQGRSLAGISHAAALKTLKAEGRPITLSFLAAPSDDGSDSGDGRDLVAARRFATVALQELGMVNSKETAAAKLELLCMLAAIDYERAEYATCIESATAGLLQKADCTAALRWRGLAAIKSRQWTLARQDWQALAATGTDLHFAMDQLGIINDALDIESKASGGDSSSAHEQRLLAAVRDSQRKLETSVQNLQAAEQRIKSQQQEVDRSAMDAAMTKRQKDRAEQQKEAARADVERQQMEILTLRQQLESSQRSQLEAGPDPVYPDHWVLSDRDKNLELKEVMRGSDEWDTVADRFQTAEHNGWEMTRVQRIQNRYLWRYWLYEKNRMRELKTNGRDITTQKLWHGTGPTEPRDIYMGQEGFDVRYSRPGLWGRGIYFALSALYSASGFGHPPVGPDNEYRGCIMLAEVLVGDSYRCRPGTYHENRPPKKEANLRSRRPSDDSIAISQTYDSCTGYTDNCGGSEVFVVVRW